MLTPHWIDRVTAPIAPRWTLKRTRARLAAELLQRHYEAASSGRRTQGWRQTAADPNAVVGPALSHLRERARDLVRNNPYAESALSTIVDHTVGWGIVAKPTPSNQKTVDIWRRWSESTDCDADGRHDLPGLEKLVMRTVVESGECLIRRRSRLPDDGFALPVQIQVLDPDFLDTTKDSLGLSRPVGNITVQGVEFDRIGRRVAYWLFPEHPGSGRSLSLQSVRVPAENVRHVFRPLSPGQVRGPSWFAPVLLRFKDFDEFEDATLMKQKIAACLAVLTTDVDGSAPPLGNTTPDHPDWDFLEPGAIKQLAAGQTVTVVDPPATRDYEAYSTTQLRAIATGLGVTYEDLTGDYCMAPETRVLRADLRWVRADELHEGDALVAFDEERPPGRGQRRKWRRASVVRAGRRDLPCIRIVTDKATVTVSNEHMFLCTGPDAAGWSSKIGYGHRWVKAEQIVAGDKIAFLAEPWATGDTHLHGYLKGIADGEGWVDSDSAHIGIAQNAGAVFDEIGAALKALGFAPRGGAANGQKSCQQWELFGVAECLRFLGEIRPTRLLERSTVIYDGKAMSGGKGKQGQQTHAIVESVETIGIAPVVTLSTDTHTVITEGLCSHNTDMPFSAARMSRLRHWARVEDWRWRILIPQFCDPVFGWAMETAAILGLAPLEVRAEWTAPPAPMVDPANEGLAFMRNIRTGIQTLPEAIRERGYDPDAVFKEIAETNKKLDELGIILDCDPRKMTQAGQAQATSDDEGRAAAADEDADAGDAERARLAQVWPARAR